MEKLLYKLELFEGPLDLLLHLITKNKLSIYDIEISEIFSQYMEHIELMKENNIEVQSEFLEMAARLVYIKTALLLPKKQEAEKLKEELQGELIEYQACKDMAKFLSQNMSFDYIAKKPDKMETNTTYELFHNVGELISCYKNAVGEKLKKVPISPKTFTKLISRPIVSILSKAVFILKSLRKKGELFYTNLFQGMDKPTAIATFLAVLELIKSKRICVVDQDTKIKFCNKPNKEQRKEKDARK